jgi:transcriptional regulator with XRE-family HTH domain
MEQFPKKLKMARIEADLSQLELGERIGVTVKSINAYENGRAIPRKATLRKLASSLDVTVEYLTNDKETDPNAGRQNEMRIEHVRSKYGEKGAREMSELLERNTAFLAGGSVDQEAKDAFFDAIMSAYLACKHEASIRFTPNMYKKSHLEGDEETTDKER